MMRSVLDGSWARDQDDIDREVEDIMAEFEQILLDLGDSGARGEKAKFLLELLTPTEIDVSMWRKIAAGENIQLPASDQYGGVAERLKPRSKMVAEPARGNSYGSVHTKGKQAPSDFMKRQGKAIETAARRVIELEEELKAARERQASLQHGLKSYATTCLLTAIRQAAAPVFAMGPAWALLCAIQSKAEKATVPGQDQYETDKILVILHAMREHVGFHRELKTAILAVCNRWEAGVRERKFGHEFGGVQFYDSILRDLRWPYDNEDSSWLQERSCARCEERDRMAEEESTDPAHDE